MEQSANKHPFRKLWAANIDGIRANLLPGVALWILGIAVVATYYGVAEARGSFERVIDLKLRYGYAYSAVATATFGGLIPFLYLWRDKQIPSGSILSWGIFLVLYWAIRGVEIDAFYRLQDWMFGGDNDWKTVVTKVAVDQFVYSLIWSAPVTALLFAWKDAGFSWSVLKPKFRRILLYGTPSVLLSIWIVWIPATAIIYSLPLPLQLPLFNLVLCFFVLLVSALSKKSTEAS